MLRTIIFSFFLFCISGCSVSLPQNSSGPRVLIVIAHPDDESAMAGTVYKLTHDLNASVDLALVTNGEGGYKYSTLAEDIYGLKLTDEKIGRAHLPEIRKKELQAGGKHVGIGRYFFLDQKDHMFTTEVRPVLREVWDAKEVRAALQAIIREGHYEYIFSLLPSEKTHGHHKAATILALQAASTIATDKRPVVLGVSVSNKEAGAPAPFYGLKEYPITKISTGKPDFVFDRTQGFGYKNRLNYKIIVGWLIAEHKSQGTMQLQLGKGDLEHFWFFDSNPRSSYASTKALFEKL